MEFLQSFSAILVLIGVFALIGGQAKAESIGQDFIYRRNESRRYMQDLNKNIQEIKEQLKGCDDDYKSESLNLKLKMYIDNLKDEKERFNKIEM
jgi:Sec-independent protein translocase protein TatA